MNKRKWHNLIKKLGWWEAYTKYLSSLSWKQKRQKRLKIDIGECRGCGSKENLQIHHKPQAYNDIPDENVNNDLTTFCDICHEAITNSIRERRYNGREIKIQSISPPRVAERKLISYGVENSTVQIEWSEPVNSAQWRLSQPAKPDSESPEENLWETREDRGRFNGIG
jgi:hypothetical protein